MRFMLHTALRLALMMPAAVIAADLGIMPVAVQLGPQHDRATVQIVNHGTTPMILQAEAIAWQRHNGVDRDTPTSDLIVNPPVFTVQPGRTQIVRLGLRRASAEAAKESTYRLVLREVPAPQDAETHAVQGNVRVLVALRLPVYVAPAVVARDERWQLRRQADGAVVAEVSNAGNVHLKIATLRLHDGVTAQTLSAEAIVGAVLFPGEARSIQLRPNAALGSGPHTLEVLTDRGPQYVALSLPSD